MNDTGLNPQGWRVLVEPIEIEEKTQSGIIVATGEAVDRERLANTTGTVVAIGSDCNGWCKPGDRIVFGKYSGLMYVGKNGKKYRIINDEDVVATLDADVAVVDPHLSKGM